MSEEDGISFRVLYTRDITQKIKRKFDGFAIFRARYRRFELYEDNDNKPGKQIACETINETDVQPNMIINLPNYIVEIFDGLIQNNTVVDEIKLNQETKPKPKKLLVRKKTTPKPLLNSNSQPFQKKSSSLKLQNKRSVDEILKIFEN